MTANDVNDSTGAMQPSTQEQAMTSAVMALNRDLLTCRELLRQGSRTFHAASLVLPAQVRAPATALYAFCRLADDAIDLGHDHHLALIDLHTRLQRVYARQAQSAVERAFAEVVARYAIPRELPDALLEGFAWDAAGRQYETIEQVYDYAARVAGTVGSMMSLLMGARDPAVLARACELGVAMQLTNIARDVGEDARMGRLYLPREWLRAEGIDPDRWLARPVFSAAMARVIGRLLNHAERLYQRASLGVAWLPPACRPGIQAARVLYAEIGHELARNGLDAINRRAQVSWQRKLQLLPDIMVMAWQPRQALPTDTLPAVRFLVEAVMRTAAAPHAEFEALSPPERRVVWLLDLFERLERQELALARRTN